MRLYKNCLTSVFTIEAPHHMDFIPTVNGDVHRCLIQAGSQLAFTMRRGRTSLLITVGTAIIQVTISQHTFTRMPRSYGHLQQERHTTERACVMVKLDESIFDVATLNLLKWHSRWSNFDETGWCWCYND